MKIGMRKPSLKKSISARTTGRAKRAVKRAVIPGYGKKGAGWIKNPKKAAYNKVYNKTTFSIKDVTNTASSPKSPKTTYAVCEDVVPDKNIPRCPNCGQPIRKSDVSDYYLCDNCKIRISPDNIQESTIPKKKKKRSKVGCLGWLCSITLLFVGISCLGILFSSDSEKETKIVSTAGTTIQTETTQPTEDSMVQTEAPVIETEASEIIVYITDTGNKYHRSGCRHLEDSKREISLSDAISNGYGPCGTCNPPTQ